MIRKGGYLRFSFVKGRVVVDDEDRKLDRACPHRRYQRERGGGGLHGGDVQ